MDLSRTIGLKPYRKNQLLYVDKFKKNCWMVAFLAIPEIFFKPPMFRNGEKAHQKLDYTTFLYIRF